MYLAEDEMPLLDRPLEHLEEQCFMLEIPLSRQDLLTWHSDAHPENLACVASAGKRARAEVQIKNLTHEEKRLFDVAKNAEPLLVAYERPQTYPQKSLHSDQTLKSRWVWTWKPV